MIQFSMSTSFAFYHYSSHQLFMVYTYVLCTRFGYVILSKALFMTRVKTSDKFTKNEQADKEKTRIILEFVNAITKAICC